MPEEAVGWCRIKEKDEDRNHFTGNSKKECEICWLWWNQHLDLFAKRTERRDRSSYLETLHRLYCTAIVERLLHSPEKCFLVFWELRPPSGRWSHPHPHLVALPGVVPDVFLLPSALTTLSFWLRAGLANWWSYSQVVTLLLLFLGQIIN